MGLVRSARVRLRASAPPRNAETGPIATSEMSMPKDTITANIPLMAAAKAVKTGAGRFDVSTIFTIVWPNVLLAKKSALPSNKLYKKMAVRHCRSDRSEASTNPGGGPSGVPGVGMSIMPVPGVVVCWPPPQQPQLLAILMLTVVVIITPKAKNGSNLYCGYVGYCVLYKMFLAAVSWLYGWHDLLLLAQKAPLIPALK